MIKVRKERELERQAYKIAKERYVAKHGESEFSRFKLLKEKKSVMKELKTDLLKETVEDE